VARGVAQPPQVNGLGHRLEGWYLSPPGADEGPTYGPSCTDPWQHAWRWRDSDGREATTWVSAASFYVVPTVRGFLLVGSCHAPGLSDGDMAWHFIDSDGQRSRISWVPEQRFPTPGQTIVDCGESASSGFRRCVFDDASMTIAPADALDPFFDGITVTPTGRVWAQHAENYAAYWSDDGGRTWSSHQPRVQPDPEFRAGGRTAWFNDVAPSRRIELSTDNGGSWRVIRLPFGISASPIVTSRGSVLAFTRNPSTLMRRGPGPSANFEPTRYSGKVGTIAVLGSTVTISYTPDQAAWMSRDDGRTWTKVA